MAAVHTPRPQADHSTATAAVRQALDLLSRASADWRNGGQSPEGPLHWPVSVNLALRELRQALEALQSEAGLRELLLEAAQRLRGWSAGAGPDGKLIARIEAAIGSQEPPTDARAGIAWWNSLTPTRRRHWLEVADSAVPADAWQAFQAGGPQP